MEQAARSLSDFLISACSGPSATTILFLCGPGNNGADTIAAARHLLGHPRIKPIVLLPGGPPAAHSLLELQENTFQKLGGETHFCASIPSGTGAQPPILLVDGLFGVGLKRPIAGIYADTLQQFSRLNLPTLAVDCPSGLNCDSGKASGPCLAATWTQSFIGRKRGFSRNQGPTLCGQIQIADIGVRRELADAWLAQHRSQQS
jgi:hydroxyethylthiazole kinase-like uncharacterized protein yjeF